LAYDTCIIGGKAKVEIFFNFRNFKPSFGIFFPSLGMSITTQLKEELLQHQWLVLFFCCIWVLNVIFNYGNSSSKKTIENVKQYQLT
jgi:hypothetical protein